MNMKVKGTIILFVITCVMAVSVKAEKIFADQNDEQKILQYLYQMYGYSQQDDIELTEAADLYDAEAMSKNFVLYIFSGTDTGYVIYRLADKCVVESSRTTVIPYNFQLSGEVKFIYNYYSYGAKLDDGTVIYRGDKIGDEYFDEDIASSMARAILPSSEKGVYLQEGNRNCIACAMAHALVYYKNNGYSDICYVTSQSSFNKLVDKMEGYLNDAGGYANNNIAAAFLKYCMYELNVKNINYLITAEGTWDPQYSQISTAISEGKPVMVGFAVGSDYSEEYGHMTLCVGAATLAPEESYLRLIDGHTKSIVSKIWNPTFNDYISVLNISR